MGGTYVEVFMLWLLFLATSYANPITSDFNDQTEQAKQVKSLETSPVGLDLNNTSKRTRCEMAIEKGLCKMALVMYGFDSASGSCVQFLYGGCGGNGNRFRTKKECEYFCMERFSMKSIAKSKSEPASATPRSVIPTPPIPIKLPHPDEWYETLFKPGRNTSHIFLPTYYPDKQVVIIPGIRSQSDDPMARKNAIKDLPKAMSNSEPGTLVYN